MRSGRQTTSTGKTMMGRFLQSVGILLCLLVFISPTAILGSSIPANKAEQGDLEEGGNQDITDIELKYNALDQINAIRVAPCDS